MYDAAQRSRFLKNLLWATRQLGSANTFLARISHQRIKTALGSIEAQQ
jgi:hypothetical protein